VFRSPSLSLGRLSRAGLILMIGACGGGGHGASGISGASGIGGASGAGHGGGTSGTSAGGAGMSVPDASATDTSASDGSGEMDGSTEARIATTSVNYEVNGMWPSLKAGAAANPIKQTSGALTYRMVQVQSDFLAESCSIADYNHDGIPDLSSGRRWYEGPDFTKVHIFRGGHDALPRRGTGSGAPNSATNETFAGASDDWADYPVDVDGDGWTDIINIANPESSTVVSPAPKPQPGSSGYWYKNPGSPANATDDFWAASLISDDLNMEEHGIADLDGDGKPEILGACKSCASGTKGYYAADWSHPTAPWTFHSVTRPYEFPFGGTGMLNGIGVGDVNGDGRPDLLERSGVWLQPAGLPALPTTGWDQATSWVPAGFSLFSYVGNSTGTIGGSQMFAVDVDGDGLTDVISADWAYGWGLSWYQQLPPGAGSCLRATVTDTTASPSCFVKHQIMNTNSPADLALYNVAFSEVHAVQVVDMDGDGLPDIVAGKDWLACPYSCNAVDPMGAPVLYVFKLVRDANPAQAGKAHFEPHLINAALPAPSTADAGAFPAVWTGGSGVGRQIAVGQINPQTDGIMDLCIASKLGLFVYFGQ
jgi:hypothetical protein